MKASAKYRGLDYMLFFGTVYLVVGVWFPNPPASNPRQFAWRVAAWILCALAFAIQIGFEHVRLRNAPRKTAFHAAGAVGLGAFGVAVAANLHVLAAKTGNQASLALALVIWPVVAGLPALVVAWVAAAGLGRLRSDENAELR
jgi:hypothetical protein